MTLAIVLQFLVVLAAIWMGARSSGIGLGLWGAVGLLVLVAGFGINPTSPPIDVMLIILAVIMAASVMEAAGGIDFLVRIAERIIRANPKYVTIVAPLTTWTFTFVAGTGHIVYPLLPVIYETAHRSGIRPERPMAVAPISLAPGPYSSSMEPSGTRHSIWPDARLMAASSPCRPPLQLRPFLSAKRSFNLVSLMTAIPAILAFSWATCYLSQCHD